MAWIELHDSTLDGPKFRALCDELGLPGVIVRGLLTGLWLHTLRHATDGCLEGWTDSDVAHYAGWDELWRFLSQLSGVDKSKERFIKALLKKDGSREGWLEQIGSHLEVHDWEDYTSRLGAAWKKRLQRERKRERLAKARAEQEKQITKANKDGAKKRNADRRVTVSDATTDLTGPDLTRPDRPDLSVTGEMDQAAEELVLDGGSLHDLKAKVKRAQYSTDVDRICRHYVSYHSKAKPSPAVRDKIKTRLKEGWTADEICLAIDGLHASPWHRGENPDGVKYLELKRVIDSSDKVQFFLEKHQEMQSQEAQPRLSGKEKRSVQTAKDWAARHKAKRKSDQAQHENAAEEES